MAVGGRTGGQASALVGTTENGERDPVWEETRYSELTLEPKCIGSHLVGSSTVVEVYCCQSYYNL